MDSQDCQLPTGPTPVLVCIPARWQARRYPGKLLSRWGSATVLRRSIDVARAAALGPVVGVADDDRLLAEARRAGVVAVPSGPAPRNGTERIAAALRAGQLGSPEVVINLQADAVGAEPALLVAAVQGLHDRDAGLATVAVGVRAEHPAGRTFATAEGPWAADFSRSTLPSGTAHRSLVHVGVYAYRAPTLLDVAALPVSPREREESLEQLRWLHAGRRIALQVVDGPASLGHAVDAPADAG